MNRGFSMIELLIYTALAIVLGLCIYGIREYKLDKSALNVGNENCQHVFVVSSEYDWWFDQYRTVSRCAKCGMVI